MSATVSTSARRGGGGGIEPDLKRQRRLLDAGGPIEDEETARQKMKDASVCVTMGEEISGFDPNSVSEKRLLRISETSQTTAMGYFSREGDLPMMRWLYVKGADAQDEDVKFWFPMYAASFAGKIDACKWLFAHGASSDVKRGTRSEREVSNGLRPLTITVGKVHHVDLCKWLILKGALCEDGDSGNLDVEKVEFDFTWSVSNTNRGALTGWARRLQQTRAAFQAFLMGTLALPEYSFPELQHALSRRNGRAGDRIISHIPPDQCQLLWHELHAERDLGPLKALSGKSGIMELIGDYVGVMRGREALITRQLAELLPGVVGEDNEPSSISSRSKEDSSEDDY